MNLNYSLTSADDSSNGMNIDTMNNFIPERMIKTEKQHLNKFKALEKSQILSGIYNKDTNCKKFFKANVKKNTRVLPKNLNQNANTNAIATNFGNQKLIYSISNDQSKKSSSYTCKSSLSNQSDVFILPCNPNKYNMLASDVKNDNLLMNYNFGTSSLQNDAQTQDQFNNSFRSKRKSSQVVHK